MSEKDEYFHEFSKAAKPLADFLKEQLSMTDAKWWKNKVVPHVLDSRSKQNLQYQKLELLDTHLLLTIYFNNMEEIGMNNRLTPQEQQLIKNYICECHSIRNKYAHQKWDLESPAEDLAREYDTLYRVCKSVHASKEFLNELAECRAYYLEKAYGVSTAEKKTPETVEKNEITITVETEQTVETSVPAAAPYCTMMPQIPVAPVYFMGMQPGMMYGMMMNSFDMRR